MTAHVGNIEQDVIVAQLAWTARVALERAEDVASWTDEQWSDLAGRAFGVSFGSIRLGVLLTLHAADDDIRAAKAQARAVPS